jgi:hypothetical protein
MRLAEKLVWKGLRIDAHAWLCKFNQPEVATTGSFVKTSANAALAH